MDVTGPGPSGIGASQIARTKAVIARKTIRAPFSARLGMSDVHPGQFLNEGTDITTLQGVDEAVHVDFTVGAAGRGGPPRGRSRRGRVPGRRGADRRRDRRHRRARRSDDAERSGARAFRRRRGAGAGLVRASARAGRTAAASRSPSP